MHVNILIFNKGFSLEIHILLVKFLVGPGPCGPYVRAATVYIYIYIYKINNSEITEIKTKLKPNRLFHP